MKMCPHDHRRDLVIFQSGRFGFLLFFGLIFLTAELRAQDTNSAAATAASDDTTDSTSSSSSNAASMNSMSSLNERSKLNNGDRVTYRVIEEQKEPVYLTVSDSGELDIPLVGRVTAAGKTCKQLAYELKPLLEKEYFYHATVIVGLETSSTRSLGSVYLEGQVLKQGAVEIPANQTLTVSKAILIVGGLADFADRRKIKLIRKKADGTSTTTIVDLVEILDKGHSDRDPVLQPDDMIIVPQRLINF